MQLPPSPPCSLDTHSMLLLLMCCCCVDTGDLNTSDMWPAMLDNSETLLMEQPCMHAEMHRYTCTQGACAHTQMLLPFLIPWLVIPTPQQFPSVCLLFESEQKTNTKKIATRPFLGSDRVPPTSGGQTDDCCTFLNHMEMHACAHTYAYTHTYIYTYLHPHQHKDAHTHARAQKLPARTRKRSRLFDADPEKMPCRIGKGRKRRKSSFEHEPSKLQNGVKVTNVLYF